MTENGKKHVDACRFCWMCRHICPIGNATGLERNTARARALGLSLVNRNSIALAEVIDNVYECACCGACTKECVTGWDPVMFIKETRLEAALEGVLPEYINTLVENCLETGNAYGSKEMEKSLSKAIFTNRNCHEQKGDILLFLGVDARYKVPEAAIRAIRVLEKAGVDYCVLDKEPASGQQLEYLIGAARETKEQMSACADVLNTYKRIVVFDPQDAKVFKREYKEWGIALQTEVITWTTYLAELLDRGIFPVSREKGERLQRAVYQDPFQLSRELSETMEPRRIAAAYAKCREMLCSGKDTMWAGNLLMKEWMPEVIMKVACDRIRNAIEAGAQVMITASVSEYAALKAVDQNEVKIISLEELILGE